ncbi:hypothetical protein LZ318_11795 [Saccharopolyspora indica]|uniref:hypothetical protein n=1 Tax=Saccharopolyspora indica TaxID=1229659 RepID=UPI0022EABD7B|nr:hypothetical protein [Saccharopolyspora indica]MDA3643806.1 hypothetical protein [Saccharopolyspora indica]
MSTQKEIVVNFLTNVVGFKELDSEQERQLDELITELQNADEREHLSPETREALKDVQEGLFGMARMLRGGVIPPSEVTAVVVTENAVQVRKILGEEKA